jgi:hypothetical protein
MFKARPKPTLLTSRDFFASMKWIDRTPLLHHMEEYRRRVFGQFFDERHALGNTVA